MEGLEIDVRQNLIKSFCKQQFGEEIFKVITTYTSEVYIGKEKVYKRYFQKDNYFFGQLSDFAKYVEFVEYDYRVNKFFATNILNRIIKINFTNNEITQNNYIFNELWIEMINIDNYSTVTESMFKDDISEKDFSHLGKISSELINSFSEIFSNLYNNEIQKGWYELVQIRIRDLEIFAKNFSPEIEEESKIVLNFISKFVEVHKQYFLDKNLNIKLAIDNHTDNLYYRDGDFVFLDVVLPNKNWVVVDDIYNIARLSADIFAISNNKQYVSMLIQGWLGDKVFDKHVFNMYVCYAAYIRRLFFIMYKKEQISEKYKNLVFTLVDEGL